MNKITKYAITAFLFVVIIIIAINLYITNSSNSQIFSPEDSLETHQVALLLGASVHADGTLSSIMEDRTLTAIELYEDGNVEKILVSGDHGTQKYDEVNAIKNFLLKNNIPAEDIFTDHAGFDTYDSVYRARDIFEVDSMIIVTQDFHLPRAVYIANSLGVESVGVIADKRDYKDKERNFLRESIARVKAFFNVILNSEPEFLGEKIPVTGDGRESWDE